MIDTVKAAKSLQEQLVAWRRYFHQYPEVGAEVPKTAKFVADKLREMGCLVKENVGGYGVIGILEGVKPGKTIAIRSDMDALNVQEETGLSFASKYPGKMHACGHDAHMAMVLGAAKILKEKQNEFKGNIKFIFQPAEEGPGGAKPMIEDGALKDPKVDAILSHTIGVLWPIPSGTIGVKAGPMTASMDRILIKIKGKGGHAAFPVDTIDPICVSAYLITALQTIVTKKIKPVEPALISIGKMIAEGDHNIIPEQVEMIGTVRCLNEKTRQKMPEYIENVIKGICSSMGASYEFEYIWGYPVLENEPEFVNFISDVAKDIFGEQKVVKLDEPVLCGDDMAFFLKECPGVFFTLGSGTEEKGTSYPHHNSRFDVDEDVFWISSALFVETAVRWLNQGS